VGHNHCKPVGEEVDDVREGVDEGGDAFAGIIPFQKENVIPEKSKRLGYILEISYSRSTRVIHLGLGATAGVGKADRL
jgi:hypothetical protein